LKAFAAVALATILVSSIIGCSPQGERGKLKVATVDIMRVMEERPETRTIRLDWASQAGDTYMRIGDVQDSAEATALEDEIAKSSTEWQKRMDDFMEESIELVQSETAIIAKERGIDIVIVDNPLTKTVRYRDGEDLTLDVSLKLQSREQ
jgi:uncharacterized membrane-anchored protein